VKNCYDARAPQYDDSEYDDWYMGLGRFAGLERREWDAAVTALERAISSLPPARTLDVACGIGWSPATSLAR
jgi:hypothetical protein